MKIEVIGSGCTNCKKLYEITKKVASEIGLKERVEYISGDKGIQRLLELGASGSPVLAIDGKVAMTGFTPNSSRIKEILMKYRNK